MSGRIPWVVLACIGVALWFATVVPAHAVPKEYQVKAAFLMNFTRFVEWPSPDEGGPAETFRIGIVGDPELVELLTPLATKHKYEGRPIVVLEVRKIEDVRDCQMVFFRSTDNQLESSVLAYLRERSVLLVGDDADFAREHGGFAFVVDKKRVGFVVHVEETATRGLQVSSKLLRLAQEIVGQEAR